MNLNALSNQIELNAVTNEFGWGQEIIYKRKGMANIATKAMCQPSEYEDSEKRTFVSRTVFMSVFLDIKPKRGDFITFEGVDWLVLSHNGNNPYDIVTESDRKNSGARR